MRNHIIAFSFLFVGSEKIVQKLIEEGANVNFRSEPYGNTALIFSSENGIKYIFTRNIVRMLLKS